MARTRDQSALEFLEEEDFFMSSSPAERNNVNSVARFRVHDGYGNSLQQAQCHESLLSISKAVIFISDRAAFEYLPCIGEIESVVPEIDLYVSVRPT
jgi:hypothetical protein